ncbi:hypothetical protein CEXT_651731 [Caerostris extrusa]|uniref:Uncharacterized protein n=1 Tax=Caerostris extrusa TaxID=172846 RepID=A0AAV4X9X9_CAEEX|nr:hypothetical protein CEXT_651731 [Caerostris extrusa]
MEKGVPLNIKCEGELSKRNEKETFITRQNSSCREREKSEEAFQEERVPPMPPSFPPGESTDHPMSGSREGEGRAKKKKKKRERDLDTFSDRKSKPPFLEKERDRSIHLSVKMSSKPSAEINHSWKILSSSNLGKIGQDWKKTGELRASKTGLEDRKK